MTSIPYQAALESGARRDMSHFGRFVVSGQDAATLLHHITTADIKRLAVGAATEAILVTSKARVLDWLTILRQSEQTYLVITSPNRREAFVPHARQYVLFRQEVKIDDVTASSAMEGVFEPGKTRTQPEETLESAWELGTRRLPGAGILRIYRNREPLIRALGETPGEFCDNETFNILRVEAGIPVAGLELTEDINPWEAGFDFAISLNKGCYNGQEVIARLHTYKKIKQELRGVRLEGPMNSGRTALFAPEAAGGKDAGALTSAADSPRFGPIGLAFVRAAQLEPGTMLAVGSPDGPGATVTNLPFSS